MLSALALALSALLASSAFAADANSSLSGLSGLGGGLLASPVATDHAHAELIADTTAIEPGKPFRIGVRYKMDPGWHIYWRNFGDTGIVTQINWSLPEGFEVGDLQWPAPERIPFFTQINYGYEGETILFAEATPPATLSGKQIVIEAKSKWLVCQDICVPGDADLKLTLPIGPGKPSADAQAFNDIAARVPKKIALGAQPAAAGLPLEWAAPIPRGEVRPGQKTTFTLALAPQAPWKFVPDATGPETLDQAPGMFPLIADDWMTTHPDRKELTADKMVYDWMLSPRDQALPAPEPVSIVVRAPMINSQTGEKKLVAFQQPLEIRVPAADTATQSSAAPATQNVSPASGRGTSGEDRKASTAANEQPGAKSTSSPGSPAQGLSFLSADAAPRHSLVYYLLFAFIGGMILNVMPCVLPVLSIKVMGIVRQAGADPRRVLKMGLVYAAGVLVSFAALAAAVVALKLGGQGLGWGFQMQDPRFVIFMSAVVLAFALSLFGVYTVELPGAATRLADGAPTEGAAGAFMNGVLATALATPCSAPFLGPAIGFAFAQPVWMIPVFFLAIGAGLAFPYVVLAASPGWLKVLPKPGRWMETFKQFMGFTLVGTLVWLMAVLGGELGETGVVWTLAFLTTVALACWLIGVGQSGKPGGFASRFGLVAALALVVAGFAFFPGPILRDWRRAVAENSGASASQSSQAAIDAAQADLAAVSNEKGGINWKPFSVPLVERLVSEQHTVFIDFTADWCTVCKVNEGGTLSTDRVAGAFARHNVTAVRADWTNRDETIRKVLAQFGAAAVPLYVILPAGHAEKAIVLSSILTPGEIENKLNEATSEKVAFNQ